MKHQFTVIPRDRRWDMLECPGTDTVNCGNLFLVKMAFHISGEQRNYSVRSQQLGDHLREEVNQSWIYVSQPDLKLIRDFT